MPELRLLPLQDTLSNTQLDRVRGELIELGAGDLPDGDDDVDLDEAVTEDQLTDFMDRLDAHDLACDLYLPVEFEGVFEVDDQKVGSAYALLEALEELREELAIDEEDSEDDDEVEVEIEEVIEEQLRFAWRVFLRAANTCVDRQVPLHIIS
jgi:hypothetical protein